MVVKAGLKPTYNLLLLRNIGYRMICFKKQFLTLLELSSDLLPTLSAPYDEVPDSMLRLLHDIIYDILAWNCPLRLTTLRKLLPFGSFRLTTLVVISPRPCSAPTTCDSVCVHTTATNNIYLKKASLRSLEPHISLR